MIRIPSKGDVVVAVAMAVAVVGKDREKCAEWFFLSVAPIHSGTEYIVDP